MSRIPWMAASAIAITFGVTCSSAWAQMQEPDRNISQPDWIKRPDASDLDQYYPAEAKGVGGKVTLTCGVTSRGTLDKCRVDNESPAGHGFGQSALMMAPLFMMRPMTVNGAPVGGGTVTIPIKFGASGGPTPPSERISVVANPPWAATPTVAQVAAAFPSKATEGAPRGRAVLRCRMTSDGSLANCGTITDEPSGRGFAQAAKKLSKNFKVFDDPDLRKRLRNSLIDIPFDFRDPNIPSPPPELMSPEWLTGGDGDIFPREAINAGLKTGVGVVACEVVHDGGLSHCSVVQETPPGVGFGASALLVASVMKMNPWTKQGFPVDGAKVKVPIRLNLDPAVAGAPPAKAP